MEDLRKCMEQIPSILSGILPFSPPEQKSIHLRINSDIKTLHKLHHRQQDQLEDCLSCEDGLWKAANIPLAECQIIVALGEGEDGGPLLAALFIVKGCGDGGGHLAVRHGTGQVRAAERRPLARSAAAPFPTEKDTHGINQT